MSTNIYNVINKQRRAGVLLHPTSLPGYIDNGDIGHEAYRFIEFLNACGFKVWQMLPLGPTHEDKSPYQCLSSHAGNPLLISLDWLEDRGWLNRKAPCMDENNENFRLKCLHYAGEVFYENNDNAWMSKLDEFTKKNVSWLDDYTLFMTFKKRYQNIPWYDWPDSEKHRDADTLENARSEYQYTIKQIVFEQFIFFTQWHEIRDYAKKYEVELFGDMPIFVARDSADVWAQRDNFLIDVNGEMEFISGVPPDAFTEAGQRWGNPLYNWEYMKSNEYDWWKERFRTQLELFDIVRIDHFRSLQACWQIPNDDETAINGRWVEVPGCEMLSKLFETFHPLPLVAEDLGVITEKVVELKNKFNLPGMKVLQFAFNDNNDNPHLPHNHEVNDVVYTGTHDNDTTLGWMSDEHNYNKTFFEDYSGLIIESTEQGLWTMIRLAMSSVSFLSVIPMQDILVLDTNSRMNIPGTVGGNWLWRFEWQQVKPEMIEKLSHIITLYQR